MTVKSSLAASNSVLMDRNYRWICGSAAIAASPFRISSLANFPVHPLGDRIDVWICVRIGFCPKELLASVPAAIYVSYMKSNTYPLAVSSDQLKDLRKAARQTGLSIADTMRQSMKLGLPELVGRLSPDSLNNLKPFTPEESRRCFGTTDPEFDALAAHCAALPVPIPEA